MDPHAAFDRLPGSSERIDACARLLLARAREADMPLSGDLRISEQDAAVLLALSPAYLKQMRCEGKAPTAYGRGMNGCRWSYRLHDLAAWIEAARDAI